MLCVLQISLLIFVVTRLSYQFDNPSDKKYNIVIKHDELSDITYLTCSGKVYFNEELIRSVFHEKELKFEKRVTILKMQNCGLSSNLTIKRILEIGEVTQSSVQAKLLEGIDRLNEVEIFGPLLNYSLDAFASLPHLKSLSMSCYWCEHATNLTVLSQLYHLNILTWKHDTNELEIQNLLSNLLALSKNLKTFGMTITPYFRGLPISLDENTFKENKKLEVVKLESFFPKIDQKTFIHLEKLKELHFIRGNIYDFNADILPSSLIILNLSVNQMRKFFLTKTFNNLTKLVLFENQLTTFRLDLNKTLLNIREVDLRNNMLKHFEINICHSLVALNLDGNDIRDAKTFEWIYSNQNRVKISFENNYPECDCSTKPMLEGFNQQNKTFIKYCKLPLPDKILVELKKFVCKTDFDSEEIKCKSLTGHVALDRIDNIEKHTAFEEHNVLNCTESNWPLSDEEVSKSGLTSVVPFMNFHLYLSGNVKISELSFPANYLRWIYLDIYVYAENCQIKSLSLESLLELKLRRLYLANNKIREIKLPLLEQLEKKQVNLTLAGNPFICNCRRKGMYDALVKMRHLIVDFDQMTCDDGLPFDPNRALCFSLETFWLYFTVVILSISTCAFLFYLRYTLEVQVYVYSRGWFPTLFRPGPDDQDYEFDVFLSYSDKDEDFVVSVIEYLEHEVSPSFKLCHHHRDWIVGERIDRQIITSIENARKTIVILSRNFLASYWSNMEFRTAHYTMLVEKAPKLVMIIYGDIGPTHLLKPEFRSYIKTTTYLASDNRWFWQKLAYALRRPTAIKIESSEPVEDAIKMKDLAIQAENIN